MSLRLRFTENRFSACAVRGGDPDVYRRVTFQPFFVAAGDQLAVVVQHLNAASIGDLFYRYGGGDYLAGDAFDWNRAEWVAMPSHFDFAFNSYVNPVPEPSTLLLVISGAAVVAWGRPRRPG